MSIDFRQGRVSYLNAWQQIDGRPTQGCTWSAENLFTPQYVVAFSRPARVDRPAKSTQRETTNSSKPYAPREAKRRLLTKRFKFYDPITGRTFE